MYRTKASQDAKGGKKHEIVMLSLDNDGLVKPSSAMIEKTIVPKTHLHITSYEDDTLTKVLNLAAKSDEFSHKEREFIRKLRALAEKVSKVPDEPLEASIPPPI